MRGEDIGGQEEDDGSGTGSGVKRAVFTTKFWILTSMFAFSTPLGALIGMYLYYTESGDD